VFFSFLRRCSGGHETVYIRIYLKVRGGVFFVFFCFRRTRKTGKTYRRVIITTNNSGGYCIIISRYDIINRQPRQLYARVLVYWIIAYNLIFFFLRNSIGSKRARHTWKGFSSETRAIDYTPVAVLRYSVFRRISFCFVFHIFPWQFPCLSRTHTSYCRCVNYTSRPINEFRSIFLHFSQINNSLLNNRLYLDARRDTRL